jgi:hypothetical protein
MIRTLCINVAWYCGEPVPYVLRHFCTVYTPPLSDTNCLPFPPPGGPGPPTPRASKMAPISPGSTHTPSTPSVTRSSPNSDFSNNATYSVTDYKAQKIWRAPTKTLNVSAKHAKICTLYFTLKYVSVIKYLRWKSRLSL